MTTELDPNGFISVGEALLGQWPSFMPQFREGSGLDHLCVAALETDIASGVLRASAQILVEEDLVLSIPGVDAVALVIAAANGGTVLPLEVTVLPEFAVQLEHVPLALRLRSDLLRPVVRQFGQTINDPTRWVTDATQPDLNITLADVTVTVSASGDMTLGATSTTDLPPCMIGESGIVIEARGIGLHFSADSPPAGQPAGWKGIHIGSASLYLPGELASIVGTLSLVNAFIGNGGFSGAVADTWVPALSTTLFGVTVSLNSVALTFVQNALTQSEILGKLTIPFFDEAVDVAIGLALDGSLAVKVKQPGGLYTVEKPGLLKLEVDSLAIEVANGVATTKVSGNLTPLFGGLDWPTFHVNELSIDSDGDVQLDGGWLNLPAQYHLDFYGFHIEITKLGFGKSDDGGKWMGFSGGVKLVDGMQAGASVEGLRVTWYDDGRPSRITLNGVGIEFEVPEVLRFKGEVAYRELPGNVRRFDGAIELDLLKFNLTVNGIVVFGTAPSASGGTYSYMALYVAADLPKGIPLFSTGVALYGMAGLFALQMEPDKLPAEEWYSMGLDDWYHRSPVGVTDLTEKWRNQQDSYAFGAGVTLGTTADNGYAFSAKTILVIVFPGPIVLLEGRGNIMKRRSALDEGEPLFRALAVLDGRAGTLLVGLDAHYKCDATDGKLIDISGAAEAFFSFHDASLWHLYLGKRDPQDQRIRASLAKLFTANAYFMLDARHLALGAWIGWSKSWSFGPLSVSLGVWLEGNALIAWRPTQLHGDLWLHGGAELSVFGFGAGLTVDARLETDLFEPFHIKGELTVGISLPWPLPDFDVDVSLEWGPRPQAPGVPLPLKEVSIEHFLATTTWPLPRNAFLLPNYEVDDTGLITPDPVPDLANASPPVATPVVPLDCRPHLTFARPVHDDAQVGVNAQAIVPAEEPVGDPTRGDNPLTVRYGLVEVALHEWHAPSWQLVARKGTTANTPPTLPTLFGSWAPMPQMPNGTGTNVGQVKLWLWSATPFDYTRRSGRAWDEGFTDRFLDYPPCVDQPADMELCCDFTDLVPGTALTSPWNCPDVPGLSITWLAAPVVRLVSPPLQGLSTALCFPANAPNGAGGTIANAIQLLLPARAKRVTLLVADQTTRCVDFTGRTAQNLANPYGENGATFTGLAGGVPVSQNSIVIANTLEGVFSGLDCRNELRVVLPQPSTFVEVSLSCAFPPANVQAFRSNGTLAGGVKVQIAQHRTTARFTSGPITQVVIKANNGGAALHTICYDNVWPSPVQAMGYDAANQVLGSATAVNHVLDLSAVGLTRVQLTSPVETCVLQVCVTSAPDPASASEAQKLSQHTIDETVRLYEIGNVLKPHTDYRLKVVTHVKPTPHVTLTDLLPEKDLIEYAYFRTDGPPGLAKLSLPPNLTTLSVPAGTRSPDELSLRDPSGNFVTSPTGARVLKTDLNTLAPYVQQTTPPTVPSPGEKPPLPRPVYRAYDIGAAFNVDYVDLMYRLATRDLGLYLYDRNNRPVRDAAGRLIVLNNLWGTSEDAALTEGEQRWIAGIDAAGCTTVDTANLTHDRTLTSAVDGLVLDADMLYEARLVPLLVVENFSGAAVGSHTVDRWSVIDASQVDAPSDWTVEQTGTPPSFYVEQTALTGDPSPDPSDPVKPGTLFVRTGDPALPSDHPEQPHQWTDYRLTTTLRSETGGALGVAFRFGDAENHYLFVMDHAQRYRRLVRIVNGAWDVLAHDEFVYQIRRDYRVTIAAVGTSLQVYLDGAPVFDVTDAVLPSGGIAFYSWRNASARFSNLRVDDFGAGAPVVYRFAFTTSGFATFFHQLHSFNDETWRVLLAADPGLAPWFALAVNTDARRSAAEEHAFEDLSVAVLAPAAALSVPQVEVTRVDLANEAVALILRSPEPIDWSRTSLEIASAPDLTGAAVPGDLKLTDVTFGTSQPVEETVTLLARRALDLTGYRVENLVAAGPLANSVGDPVLLSDPFDGPDSGLLYREGFGVRALDQYTITDHGSGLGPSLWEVVGGEIVSERRGTGVPLPPESFALLTASRTWTNVGITATLRSTDSDAFGLVCRYESPDDCYRLTLDRTYGRRRFIKRLAGTETVLWEDNVAYQIGQMYTIELQAFGDQFVAAIDSVVLFNLKDADLPTGQCGFYVTLTTEMHVAAFSIEARESAMVLAAPTFVDLSEVEITDVENASGGPSAWNASAGILSQTTAIQSASPFADNLGTIAVLGDPAWGDVEISLLVGADVPGAVGVAFRYRDSGDAYRFSLDSASGQRRLLRVIGANSTVLWSDSAAPAPGITTALTLRAEGNRLQGFIDGAPLFSVTDSTLVSGRLGVFTAACPGAHFSQVRVLDSSRRAGQWRIADEGTTGGPSVWRLRGGVLIQTSTIGGGASPALPGTMALGGDANWQDYRLTARLRSDASAPIGLTFRYVDVNNYYRLHADPTAGTLSLVSKAASVVSVLWSGPGAVLVGIPCTLTVDALGSRLIGYLADERVFDLTDTAHVHGQVGVYCAGNDGARFESAEVRLVPQETRALIDERLTEAVPTGWMVTPSGRRIVAGDLGWSDILWTARTRPLLSSTFGLVLRYADENNFYQFTWFATGVRQLMKVVGGVPSVLWEDATALAADASSDLTVALIGGTLRGFLDRVPLFVVEDTSLAAGRVGLFANDGNPLTRFASVRALPTNQAFSTWLLDDPFTSLVPGRWTFLDADAPTGPSQWAVTNGEMVQTSAIHGGVAGQPDQPGTAALAGDLEWTDSRLSARLRSDGDGVIGVYARYRDEDDHYLFAMERVGPAGTRRLIKKVAGVVSVVHEDTIATILGREYLVTMDCIGDSLQVFIDGVLWCAIRDAGPASGRSGLYCWNNPGAHWAEIRVAAPSWTTLYRFAEDDPVAAGTRVVLSAGNVVDSPALGGPVEPIPGVVQRFLALLDAQGELHLPSGGATLRLTAPGGAAGATRRFLPPSQFTTLPSSRVLRKADGTACVIILPDATATTGSRLPPGTYRLRLEYRRDNRAHDPNSSVYSQALDRRPEQVTLDVPWQAH